LDGNTAPPGSNAEGPAHDNFVKTFACTKVPALSNWGLIVMVLIFIASGSIMLLRHRVARQAG
jgi:hypothetical protein